ncbi:relaxase domain-containing protein [Pseudofrankia sp. DC12]|uniref:relaxase domain-containing protein n=1 Tax=Pseudofrankia sp. DC12 TaxID=683315 RepID=UPI0005F85F00|nr:relaxase domain-containing protein [Pseudofrankia sp. DC12]
MIATAKVLRVRARRAQDVDRAAGAVVAYVQGGQPEDALAGYYGRGHARGRARGRLAGLVGLRGEVSGAGLERLLRGRHAVTGLPLLSGPGPASRMSRAAGRRQEAGAAEAEWLTLAEAAPVVQVSADYLRRLVKRTAEAGAAVSAARTGDLDESGGDAAVSGGSTGAEAAASAGRPGEQLAGVRGSDGRWRVRRADLERWNAGRVPPATVLGYDVVCAAPKSVSLLWAFGDEALRADVGAALDAAVEATIGYLERHAAFGLVLGAALDVHDGVVDGGHDLG